MCCMLIEDERYEAPLAPGATLKQPRQPWGYAQAAPALHVSLPVGPPGSEPDHYAYAVALATTAAKTQEE